MSGSACAQPGQVPAPPHAAHAGAKAPQWTQATADDGVNRRQSGQVVTGMARSTGVTGAATGGL